MTLFPKLWGHGLPMVYLYGLLMSCPCLVYATSKVCLYRVHSVFHSLPIRFTLCVHDLSIIHLWSINGLSRCIHRCITYLCTSFLPENMAICNFQAVLSFTSLSASPQVISMSLCLYTPSPCHLWSTPFPFSQWNPSQTSLCVQFPGHVQTILIVSCTVQFPVQVIIWDFFWSENVCNYL